MESTKPLISIVAPAYNEAALIQQNLATLRDYMRGLEDRFAWELLVVNDGSTDDTGALAEAFAADNPEVRVLHHVVNLNLGQALRTGFAQARGDYVVVLDLDLSYSPDHVERLVDTLLTTKCHVVVASPYMEGGKTTAVPWLRLLLSRNANRYLAWFCHQPLRTITGMVRGYDRSFLERLNLKAMDIEINTEIIYKTMLLRGRIVEIPAHLDWSQQRESAGRVSSFRVLRGIATYTFSGFVLRPFAFFLLPGLLCMLLSLYVLGWLGLNTLAAYDSVQVANAFFDDRFSEAVRLVFEQRPHAFVVGGVALIFSLQLITMGLLSIQQKRYFEELFHIASTHGEDPSMPLGKHKG